MKKLHALPVLAVALILGLAALAIGDGGQLTPGGLTRVNVDGTTITGNGTTVALSAVIPSGTVSGTLTTNRIPTASGAHTLANSNIADDFGAGTVTFDNGIAIKFGGQTGVGDLIQFGGNSTSGQTSIVQYQNAGPGVDGGNALRLRDLQSRQVNGGPEISFGTCDSFFGACSNFYASGAIKALADTGTSTDRTNGMQVYTTPSSGTLTPAMLWRSDQSTDFLTHQAHNLVDPSSAQDAATKNYVDNTAIAAAVSGTAPDLAVFASAHVVGNYGGSSPSACSAGQGMTGVSLSAAGILTPTCNNDITSVVAGTGITTSTTSGAATINVGLNGNASQSCTAGQAVTGLSAAGIETCTALTTFNTTWSGATSSSAELIGNAAASATVPTLIPNSSSTTSGVGADASGDVSIIAGGTEAERITSTGVRFLQFPFGTNTNSFGLLTANASATAPTLVPNRADTTTGIGADTSGDVSIIAAATERLRVGINVISLTDIFGSATSAWQVRNIAASGTVPTIIPNRSSTTTGIGADTAGHVSLIQGGVEALRVDGSNGIRFLAFGFNSISTGWSLNNVAATATAPVFSPNRTDTTTGIGANAAGSLDLIAGGVDVARVTSTGITVNKPLYARPNDYRGTHVEYVHECNTTGSVDALSPANAGTGATMTVVTSSAGGAGARPGICQLQTGTTTTGSSDLRTTAFLYPGDWTTTEVDVVGGAVALSSGTDEFIFLAGEFGTADSATQSAGCFFVNDRGNVLAGGINASNTQNLEAVAANGGTRTRVLLNGTSQDGTTGGAGSITTCTATMSATSLPNTNFHNYAVIQNGTTNCQFLVDGSLCTTLTTNIPASGTVLEGGSFVLKSAGTTNKSVYEDVTRIAIDFPARSP